MNIQLPWTKIDTKNQALISYDAHRNNLGDILSPMIANYYGSKKIKRISKRLCKRYEHYFMIGSILQRSTKNSIIWGSGFIAKNSVCKEKPKKVLAVRGPKTRDKLLEQGIECPEIYGDPALLLPEVYPVKEREIKYKLGIIPHYLDKSEGILKKYQPLKEVKIIDIQNKDPLKVIDEMLSCENIASSSLHGVIIADAYRIPSLWIQFSKPLEGGSFKFQDYFKSVNRIVKGPKLFNQFIDLDDVLKAFEPYEISIDLERLKKSFPF